MKILMKNIMIAVMLLFISGCGRNNEPPSLEQPETSMTESKETVAVKGECNSNTLVSTVPTETEMAETEEMTGEVQIIITDETIVAVKDYIPDICVDLKYATEDNFTGKTIYNFQNAYLRYGTVKKLAAVQEELLQLGYGLKLWDGFRPVSAQFTLWEICPDANYVANPNKGFSSHSRGNTVDVTLVDMDGDELEMPSGFDDFTYAANRDYSECEASVKENAMLLQTTMEKHGFSGYFGEWWHFSDTVKYDVENEFDPE